MAMMNPEELNPFQAPTAAIGTPTLTGLSGDAELIRRAYLSHEASIKALGTLNYLVAFFSVFGVVIFALGALGVVDMSGNNANPELNPRLIFGIAAGAFLVGLILYGGMGYGLRHLQPWARWVTIVLMGLSLFSTVVQIVILAAMNPVAAGAGLGVSIIPSLITGYIFYLVASAKGAMVFSREYREIVRQTPHIKQKTSLIVKVLLGLLVAFLLFLAVAGAISALGNR